ncbi:hypothetical protein QTL86_09130 [Cellulosilyticum sp. ST5]|uniref:hypothetical protein n=1 Tax=Cellulosilyticum sp. ST5 TaxID=3055805 RepID=UPI003977BDBE
MNLTSPSTLGGIMPIFMVAYFIIRLVFIGLTIYALILLIKALKIYIKKNS